MPSQLSQDPTFSPLITACLRRDRDRDREKRTRATSRSFTTSLNLTQNLCSLSFRRTICPLRLRLTVTRVRRFRFSPRACKLRQQCCNLHNVVDKICHNNILIGENQMRVLFRSSRRDDQRTERPIDRECKTVIRHLRSRSRRLVPVSFPIVDTARR